MSDTTFSRPPQHNRQEAELISKINIALNGLSIEGKISILSKILNFWETEENKDNYLAMVPLWEEQVALQDNLIKKLERVKRLWAILAIVEFLIIIYKFWEW